MPVLPPLGASATLGDLVTCVRDRLDEATSRYWSDAQLRHWLNEGARDIARRTECLMAESLVAVVAGTQTYLAPTDAIRIHMAEYMPTGQDTIYQLEIRQRAAMEEVWGVQQAITQGYPSYLTVWGYPPSLNFILYPTPSVAGDVRVSYYRLPEDLATDGTADADSLDVPMGWGDLACLFAEYTALRRDRDQRWVEAKQLYEERLNDLYGASVRWTDAAGLITTAGGRGVPSWLHSFD